MVKMKRFWITCIVFSAFTALNYAYAEEIKTTTSIAMDLQATKNKLTTIIKEHSLLTIIFFILSPLKREELYLIKTFSHNTWKNVNFSYN